MTRYCRPTSLEEALALKAQSAEHAPLTVLAGLLSSPLEVAA